MTYFSRLLISLITVLLCAQSALAADTLVIFSGRSDKFVKPVVKAFTDRKSVV